MFPQIPFGFMTNTRLFEATSEVVLKGLSTTAFVGEVKNATSSVVLNEVTTSVPVGLLQYGESTVQIPGLSVQSNGFTTYLATSVTDIAPITTKAVLSLSTGVVDWTPSVLNTQLWYDALDEADLMLSSGFVQTWLDKSGRGRHATQTDPALRLYYDPTLKGVKNIQESRYLTALLNDFVTGTGNQYQVYIVATPFENKGSVSSESTSGVDFFNERDNLNIAFYSGDSLNTTIDTVVGISGDSVYATETKFGFAPFHISRSSSGGVNNKTFLSIKRDNTRQLSTVVNFGSVANAQVGSNEDVKWEYVIIPYTYGGGTNWWNGLIHAFILVFGNLSADDDLRMQGYLAHRHNMVAQLPVDHPYKVYPPII